MKQERHIRGEHSCLDVAKLSSGYGKSVVIDDISLPIGAGKFTSLIGPNGSGKSTLLMTIARLLKPSQGSVLLDGRSIHEQPTKDVAKKVGILPQSPLLPEGLSVFDLVSRGRFPHQGLIRQWSDADEQAVCEAISLTGIGDFTTRPVDSLSGGQRQRVWIAMALAQATPIVLLDEPTTFLDLRYQVDVLRLLRSLTEEFDRTVIAVLHELNLALDYSDVTVMLKDGKIRHLVTDKSQLTAEMIEDVFGLKVHLSRHPDTGTPLVIPRATQSGVQ